MAKHHDFLFNIAKLCGDKNYARHDRRNQLIYHDELKGNSPFNRTDEDKDNPYSRLSVFFDGLPDGPLLDHCMGLTRLIELYHYKHAHKITDDEFVEIVELEAELLENEEDFPVVAAVLSASEVSDSVASTASGDRW